MKVKFLREFRGRETKEIYYPTGFEVDLDDGIGQDLVNRGICESDEAQPEVFPEVVSETVVIKPVKAPANKKVAATKTKGRAK